MNPPSSDSSQHPEAVDEQFFRTQGLSLDNLVVAVQTSAPQENLRAAMKEARLDQVEVWIGYSDRSLAEVVGKILRPKVHIPHHWDGLFSSFFIGAPYPYTLVAGSDGVAAVLKTQSIALLPPQQYMDAYQLTVQGVTLIANEEIKRKLGLPPVLPTVSEAERGRMVTHSD